MIISNIKIKNRLNMGFGLLLIITLFIGGLGISRMSFLEKNLITITDYNNVQSEEARRLLEVVSDGSLAITNWVLMPGEKEKQAQLDRLRLGEQQYNVIEKRLTDSLNSQPETLPEEKAAYQAILDAQTSVKPLMEKVIALGMANQAEQSAHYLEDIVRPARVEWRKRLLDLAELESRLNVQLANEARMDYSFSRNLLIACLVAAWALSTAVAIWISRSITDPLEEATAIAKKVTAGDLTSQISSNSRDEIGLLITALQTMNDSLSGIVRQVRSGTDTITSASSEIASGNMDLASRTERQASSLEETATSMEELTSTVKQNADNASQANDLAKAASEVAIKGGSVVSKVVETMEAINESSRRIVDIISVIDGIAFQTNILALNAAVEAARAGEQGRGFAVVASEVRSLAQRSAAAAKEIKELIGDSVEKVDIGSKLVNQAGNTMSEVVESIRHVTNIVSEISSASHEQSQGIDQVNQAIIEMDNVTQQNAALVEQAAAAAASMQDQSANLLSVVSVFKVTGDKNEGIVEGRNSDLSRLDAALAGIMEQPSSSPNRVSGSAKATANRTESKPKPAPRVEADSGKPAAKATTIANGWEEF